MKTYQDLVEAGNTDKARGAFCRKAVDEFKASREYKDAQAGEAYYNKHNLTIEKFQKMLYTVSGREVPDIWSANYKLKTLFFRRLVTQQVQYVLGNGVIFNEINNKEKLGKDFDFQLQRAAKRAMAGGRSFGFWNNDHLEVFGYADTPADPGFCPLLNEDTADLDAGIRFWSREVGDSITHRFTLYEADGITEYIQKADGEVELLKAKTAYKQVVKETKAQGVISVDGENYGKLPIVQLFANDSHESELVGIRESIDCYDFIKSGLANDIDDTSGFYWILKNSGGMEDVDLAKFIQRMKTVKATTLDGDEGVTAEPHTLDIPIEARSAMISLLREDIYEDFQALDVKTSLSAAAKTTQEIQAAYQSQDNKCADFEYFLIDFVQQILEIAGISDEPTFKWNRVVNMLEQTQMILQAASLLPQETVVKHLPFLTPEEVDEILQQQAEEDVSQFDDEDDNADLEELNAMLDDLLEGFDNE